jgi:antitoxin VapB
MSQKTAKLFMNGRSQAVRLPKEFRFEGKEVYVHREGEQVILSPKAPHWQDLSEQSASSTPDLTGMTTHSSPHTYQGKPNQTK